MKLKASFGETVVTSEHWPLSASTLPGTTVKLAGKYFLSAPAAKTLSSYVSFTVRESSLNHFGFWICVVPPCRGTAASAARAETPAERIAETIKAVPGNDECAESFRAEVGIDLAAVDFDEFILFGSGGP